MQADPDKRHRKSSSSSFNKLINTSNLSHIFNSSILITSVFIFQNHLFSSFKKMSQKLAAENFHVLKKAWLQYVHEEKEKQSEVGYLPKARRCSCNKSLTSYPHWPPTTYDEAMAQLNCLIGESYPHRIYLAECWVTSLYVKMATGSEGIEHIISLIEETCQSLNKSPKQRGPYKVDCRKICEPALKAKGTANGASCLCDCSRHREECPVHERAPLYHCIQ